MLERILLALIAMKEQTAYDVRRLFLETPLSQYSASPGSLYPAMKRLDARGLLAARAEPGDKGRPRRVYAATDAARRLVETWVSAPPTMAELRTDIRIPLFRFAAMGALAPREAAEPFVNAFQALCSEYRRELVERRSAFDPSAHAHLALDNAVRAMDAHIAWADMALSRIARPKND